MTDDIVRRLRDVDHPVSADFRIEAAAEIERLRSNVGCARNQGTTQFCHEALDAQRDVERLRTQLEMWQDGNIMAESHRDEIAKLERTAEITYENHRRIVAELTAERDEARRKYCYTMASNSRLGFTNPKWFAEEEDWDCFKETAHAS